MNTLAYTSLKINRFSDLSPETPFSEMQMNNLAQMWYKINLLIPKISKINILMVFDPTICQAAAPKNQMVVAYKPVSLPWIVYCMDFSFFVLFCVFSVWYLLFFFVNVTKNICVMVR